MAIEQTAEQRARAIAESGQSPYNATDASGNPVIVGNPDLNPQFNYGPTPSSTSSAPEATRYSRYTESEKGAESYLDTFKSPLSVEEIQKQKLTQAQSRIDSINRLYDVKRADQLDVNLSRDRRTNAMSVLTGLSGSTEAVEAANETSKVNQRSLAALEDLRATEINAIYSQIQNDAVEEARAQREEATTSAESILTRRKERQERAVSQLINLAKSGVTISGLRSHDRKTYDYLVDQVGGEDQLNALFTLNRPQDTILDKQIKDGKYVIAYRNPITGGVKIETLDLGLPQGYTKSVDIGDRMMFLPDNFNPSDPNSLQPYYVSKGLTPDQAADNAKAGTEYPAGNQSPFVSQPAYAKLTATQKKQADSLNNLVWSLQDFRNYYNEKPGIGGANLFGVDSAVLQSKINGIIFAAAQAEGTGALQAADREVIQKMLPNPTTWEGGLNILTKGGKTGALAAIDDQKSKYTKNLSGLGLSPIDPVVPDAQPTGTDTPATDQAAGSPPKGTDGTAYGFPGYHSDGTQWVPN